MLDLVALQGWVTAGSLLKASECVDLQAVYAVEDLFRAKIDYVLKSG